jgi:hypothetical protein
MMSLCNDYYLASSSGGINITRINTVVKQQEQRLLRSRQNMSTGAWISPAKAGRVRVRSHHSRERHFGLRPLKLKVLWTELEAFGRNSSHATVMSTPEQENRNIRRNLPLLFTYGTRRRKHWKFLLLERMRTKCRYRSEQSSTSSSPSLQSNL